MGPTWKRPAGLVPRRAVGTAERRAADDPTLTAVAQRAPMFSVVAASSTRRSGAVSSALCSPCCCWRGGDRASASCIACARWRRVLRTLQERRRAYR